MKRIAILALAGVVGIIGASSDGRTGFSTATAQSQCRFDDTGAICVCRRGGGWRIYPDNFCSDRGRESVRVGPPSLPPVARDPDLDREVAAGLREPPEPGDFEQEARAGSVDDYSGAPATAPESAPFPGPSEADRRARADIARAQRVMNAMGCEAGAADGVIGRGTRAAIRCFQAAMLRSITGKLTADELAALSAAADQLPTPPATLMAGLRADLNAPTGASGAVDEEDLRDVGEDSGGDGFDHMLDEELAYVSEPELTTEDDRAQDTVARDAVEDVGELTADQIATVDDATLEDTAADEALSVQAAEEVAAVQDAVADETATEEAVDAAAAEDEAGASLPQLEATFGGDAAGQPTAERCAAGFTAGGWSFEEPNGSPRAVARGLIQNVAPVEIAIRKGAVTWSATIKIDNPAYIATLIDSMEYVFVQTDGPETIGFEDVTAFKNDQLVVPIGSANTVALMASGTLMIAGTARGASPDAELKLYRLATFETDGLARVLSCL